MKAGDELTITMEGFSVGTAVIEQIEDGKATIYIPATRVVMGVKQSLTDVDPEVDRIAGTINDGVGGGTSEAIEQQIKADDVGDGLSRTNLDSSAVD